MADPLRELSAGTGGGASDATEILDPILQDEERVQYVLATSNGIERTTDGETTTLRSGSHNGYAVITDFRVLFLVGGDSEELSADVEFDLAAISTAKVRSSLLSSSLVVVAEGTTTVKFKPLDGSQLEDAADYVDRLSDSWADFQRAIASTRDAIDAFEERLRAGEDAQEELTTAQSRLSNAHHHATRHEDGPAEAMLAMLEPVEEDLDGLQVGARLDRVDDLIAAARDRDEFDAAAASLVEARDRLAEARDVFTADGSDGDAVPESIAERSAAVEEYAGTLLADAEDACHRALEAGDSHAAADAWKVALERYRALLAADWDGLGGVDADALRYQLAWVVGNRIDALCALSAELEREGDELDEAGDDSTASYEQAKAHAESARNLAADHAHTNADRFDDRLDDLQEKIEVSEWQWGDA